MSIHALREEGDSKTIMLRAEQIWFSIHALREEGDEQHRVWMAMQKHFYPRPPRGGRPDTSPKNTITDEISIHALREEGDA